MATYRDNPAYNMEMTAGGRAGADDVFGADDDTGRAKMVAVSNPLHSSPSSPPSSSSAKGKAHWGAIRSKVQTRIEMRKEETARKGLSKSGRMVAAMLDKLQNEDGSINRRTAELMRALEKREQGYEDTDFFDRLSNELFITGKLLFELLTPGQTGQGLFIWTSLYTIINVVVFVYMAADYSWYLYAIALEGNPQHCPVESPFKDRFCLPANYHNGSSTTCDDVCTSTVTPYGIRNSTLAAAFDIDQTAPRRALGWLANFVIPGQSSDEDYVLHHFDASYLVSWGGRYIPNINKVRARASEPERAGRRGAAPARTRAAEAPRLTDVSAPNRARVRTRASATSGTAGSPRSSCTTPPGTSSATSCSSSRSRRCSSASTAPPGGIVAHSLAGSLTCWLTRSLAHPLTRSLARAGTAPGASSPSRSSPGSAATSCRPTWTPTAAWWSSARAAPGACAPAVVASAPAVRGGGIAHGAAEPSRGLAVRAADAARARPSRPLRGPCPQLRHLRPLLRGHAPQLRVHPAADPPLLAGGRLPHLQPHHGAQRGRRQPHEPPRGIRTSRPADARQGEPRAREAPRARSHRDPRPRRARQLCGLFPSFLFLPNFHSERWEAVLAPLGGLTVLIMLLIVPISIYANLKSDLKGFIGEDCMALYAATTC